MLDGEDLTAPGGGVVNLVLAAVEDGDADEDADEEDTTTATTGTAAVAGKS